MGNCYWDLLCDPGGRGGRGGWGCGAEHRQWRMQRGGASVAVEKIEQASSAKIFSGTARRQGLRFAEEWAAEEILDQVGSRLAAGRGLLDIKICMPTRQGIVCGRLKASRRICRVQSLYGSPPGRSFCAYKRNQNTLGAAPQDPDASVHPARKAKATASRSGIRRRL